MNYVINDYYNLISSPNSIIMFNIAPYSDRQRKFYKDLLTNNIDGLIVFVNNKHNLKLLMLLNELDIPIIVVSSYDLTNMGLKVVRPYDLTDLIFRDNDQKVTRPFKIDIVEKYIKLIEDELINYPDSKRFIAIQILYENPYFDFLVNDIIKEYKLELEEQINKSSKKIIDETLDYFIEHSFLIK